MSDPIRASLERIEDKLDERLDKLTDAHQQHTLEDEKRFGRIDKLLVLIFAALAAPKIGLPSAHEIAASVVASVRG